MKAMVLHAVGAPLRLEEIELGAPGPGQIELAVRACAVCRTDLHVVDGDLPSPKLPLILGHEIVGEVLRVAPGVTGFAAGDRVGVPWLGHTCGQCSYCTSGRENLCDDARFTGYQIDGGFAERALADQRFCFRLPDRFDDVHAAPLLCAGLIGYRTLSMAGPAERIGIYGFGAAAHIVAQVARAQGRTVYAFTRPGDLAAQDLARSVGAVWAGASTERPPVPLDAALIFAPIGALVPQALAAVVKGGVVVAGGIHMSDIPSFRYELLWGERVVRSVANLTRADGEAFLALAAALPLALKVEPYPLSAANEALHALRRGAVTGAAVLVPD